VACLASIILTLLNDWGLVITSIDEFSSGLVKLVNGGAMVRGGRVNRDSNSKFMLHIVSISGTTLLLSQTQKD
jgi:hypothetical protein